MEGCYCPLVQDYYVISNPLFERANTYKKISEEYFIIQFIPYPVNLSSGSLTLYFIEISILSPGFMASISFTSTMSS